MSLAACENSSRNTGPLPVAPVVENKIESTPQICSFNIQFLGNSKLRKNKELAELLKNENCSMVVVQEIVAPPDLRLVPNNPYFGTENLPVVEDANEMIRPQPLVTEFFLDMTAAGYDSFWLSEQDSGPVEKNNNNGSATEWFAVFYKSSIWDKALDLPNGFLAKDVTNNLDYDRVPYAFSFRDKHNRADFVLISVHLRPGAGSEDTARRGHEISEIQSWIAMQKKDSRERDYIVLGDFNIESEKELLTLESEEFQSLNIKAVFNTNTNVIQPKPYDHIFISPKDSSEVPLVDNFKVIDLIQKARVFWNPIIPFPGEPYNHNIFRLYYSDHHPISFVMTLPERDDD